MDPRITSLGPHPDHRASRAATAVALVTILAISLVVVWLATSRIASEDGATTATGLPAFPRESGVGACLRVAQPPIADAQPVAAALAAAASAHEHLFPELGVSTVPSGLRSAETIVALWPGGAPPAVDAEALARDDAHACAPRGRDWALAVTRETLADGADRLLADADLGSDWSAVVDVSFRPARTRVRSTLHFRGPFGIEGSCWIDETLVIDLEAGLPEVVRTSGHDAGLPGLVACRRFEAELAAGGAGAQAVALFPAALAGEGGPPVLTPTGVEVTDELVVIFGGDA